MPDESGHFGQFGGRFVPETLMHALEELQAAYSESRGDAAFQAELGDLSHLYAGRPTPLYYASNLTEELGGARIYLKREDLAHTGAHKINNALGQGLLARRMGKERVIAETGAGQHGVAAATVCAMLKQECVVYMGEKDIRRQSLNVFRMRLLGAEVRPVDSGSRTLKDAINECIRDWVTNVETTHYLIGSVVGPHPYPMMVRDFQSVIGRGGPRSAPGSDGQPAGLCDRVRRGRQQRHRPIPPIHPGRERAAGRRRGGGRRREPRSHAGSRRGRSAPRQHVLPASGRRRSGAGDP